MPPSAALATAFVSLTLGSALLVFWLVRRAYLGPDGEPVAQRALFRTFFGLGLWMALTAALGSSGVLADFDRTPPPLLVLLSVALVGSLVISFSPFGTRVMETISTGWLLGIQGIAVLAFVGLAWAAMGVGPWLARAPFVWLPTVLLPFGLVAHVLWWRRVLR
ncbi:MAG: hypothetical protein AAF436_14860 [Myxococcota bacterium]